jgi:FkbM family methyltransferase
MSRSLFDRLATRYRQLTFRPRIINRRIAGEEIQFFVGDLFGADWYGPRHDPWPELEWIKANGIQRGDCVIDCGANHGFTTVLFARWAGPEGLVYAFEPYQHNVEILRKNLKLNNVDNVRVRPVAVGAENATATLGIHPNAAILKNPKAGQRIAQVPLRRLDDEIDEKKVDFMKVDVEGFELEVLKGAQRILAGRPRLALEVHVCMYENKAEELEELFGLIPLANYSVQIQPVVDGPIRDFDPKLDTPRALSGCDVVHLFCT